MRRFEDARPRDADCKKNHPVACGHQVPLRVRIPDQAEGREERNVQAHDYECRHRQGGVEPVNGWPPAAARLAAGGADHCDEVSGRHVQCRCAVTFKHGMAGADQAAFTTVWT